MNKFLLDEKYEKRDFNKKKNLTVTKVYRNMIKMFDDDANAKKDVLDATQLKVITSKKWDAKL